MGTKKNIEKHVIECTICILSSPSNSVRRAFERTTRKLPFKLAKILQVWSKLIVRIKVKIVEKFPKKSVKIMNQSEKPNGQKCDDKRLSFNFSELCSKCFSNSPNDGDDQSLNRYEPVNKAIANQQREQQVQKSISCINVWPKRKPLFFEETVEGNYGSIVKHSSQPNLETIFENGGWEHKNDQWPGPSTQSSLACEPPTTIYDAILFHQFDSDNYTSDSYAL